MSDRWYYQLLLEEFGPVSVECVLELLHLGTLAEGDLVRSEAGGDWILISAMKASCQASASNESMLEEIQDLSELNFKFETSSSASSRSSHTSNTTAKSPNLEQTSILENGKRRRIAANKETSKVSPSKRNDSSGKLSDAVFSDVVQKNDSTTQRAVAATASLATSPTSAGLAAAAANSRSMQTPSSISLNGRYSAGTSSSPCEVDALNSVTSGMRTVPLRKAYTPPPKRKISVSEPMDVKKVGTVAGAFAVIACALAIPIFGLPFGGDRSPDTPFDPKVTAAILKSILKNFGDLTMTTDASAFDECMDSVKPQMAAILAITQDPKNNTPEAAACQAATKALMKIADSFPDKQDDMEQGVVEFQKQIAMVQ